MVGGSFSWFDKEISTCYQGFFIVGCALVNRACSWLFCIIRNILSKKSWLGFSPSLGFSQDKSLCLLVLVYLLLDPYYSFSIWLLNVK
jgi:hypothetical protein